MLLSFLIFLKKFDFVKKFLIIVIIYVHKLGWKNKIKFISITIFPMKKLVFLMVTFLFGMQNTYAQVDFQDFRQQAENFIQYHSENLAWKWFSPIITKETLFYSSDDTNPSYIEYKISCSDTKDCGWIMLNIDNTDAPVPIASFAWGTMSEALNPRNEKGFKYYYFGIFDYFAINQSNNKIAMIWPDGSTITESINNSLETKIITSNKPSTHSYVIDSFQALQKQVKENINEKKIIKILNYFWPGATLLLIIFVIILLTGRHIRRIHHVIINDKDHTQNEGEQHDERPQRYQ